MVLDRLLGQEEGLGDLAVGHPLRRHPRDAQLACRERAAALDRVAPGSGAGGDELVVGACCHRSRPAHERKLESGAKRVAGGGPLARSAQRRTELAEE